MSQTIVRIQPLREVALIGVSRTVISSSMAPPLPIRRLIEKTAEYVVKNGPEFEEKIRKNNTDHKFDFLLADDEWHLYYLEVLEAAKQDSKPLLDSAAKPEANKAPPELHFITPLPTISTRDYEVVKLVAKYTAVNGYEYATKLQEHYKNDPIYDFIREEHHFYKLFRRLVDQYRRLIELNEARLNGTSNEYLDQLKETAKDFSTVFPRATERSRYITHTKKVKSEEKEAKKKQWLHFASIPWTEFTVVGVVEFTEVDEVQQLDPPLSLKELQYKLISRQLPKEDEANKEGDKVDDDDEEEEEVVPKLLQGKIRKQPTKAKSSLPTSDLVKCPLTGKMIPALRFDEHLRAHLRDPAYRTERENYIRKNFSAGLNISTDDVVANIQRMVRKRGAADVEE